MQPGGAATVGFAHGRRPEEKAEPGQSAEAEEGDGPVRVEDPRPLADVAQRTESTRRQHHTGARVSIMRHPLDGEQSPSRSVD